MIPVYLRTLYRSDPFFRKARSVLTVHNLAYQGTFPARDFEWTGLEARHFDPKLLEFHGGLNLLKGGLVAADLLTTVSPTYAREILSPEMGCGLEGVLNDRKRDLRGILNGVDLDLWNPETDRELPARYGADRMEGKKLCKASLQREMGLPQSAETPLIAVVSRLDGPGGQKGVDLIADLIPTLTDLLGEERLQWAILGSGNIHQEGELARLSRRHPRNVSVRIGFDSALAHRIEAGADFFLMPSRYEPCGYSQMYGMLYGTIPVVRATGGLKDTVRDLVEDPARGTGILFERADVEDAKAAVLKCLNLFRDPERLAAVRRRAMAQDFSWNRSAAEYVDLYRRLLVP